MLEVSIVMQLDESRETQEQLYDLASEITNRIEGLMSGLRAQSVEASVRPYGATFWREYRDSIELPRVPEGGDAVTT